MPAATLPLLIAALPLADPGPAPERPWTSETTLSLAASSGNTRGQNLGLEEAFTGRRGRSTLALQGRAARTTATTVERTAVGSSSSDYDVRDQVTSAVTTENFHADIRLDRRLEHRERLYGFAASAWTRDLPAGLDHRLESQAGFGRIWAEGGRNRFRTDLGLGWAYETPRFARHRARDSYPTGNLTARLERRLGAAAYQGDLAYSLDLAELRDYQASLRQSLRVALGGHLALKVGLDLAYRNVPNLIPVPIQSRTNPSVTVGTAGVPARRTDAAFTTGLAVTFK